MLGSDDAKIAVFVIMLHFSPIQNRLLMYAAKLVIQSRFRLGTNSQYKRTIKYDICLNKLLIS